MTDIDPFYQPKHLNAYDDSTGHCCFAGCTPMGCEGGCCASMGGWHKASCPANPFRVSDEGLHAHYVDSGMRKHLLVEETQSVLPPPPPPPTIPVRLTPEASVLSTSASIYPDRFDYREQHLEEDLSDKSPLSRWRRIVRRPRHCSCGDVARHPNGCGPSGCINRPA